VFQLEDADYRFRALVSRETVKQVVARQVECINYDNFKKSVRGWELHQSYLKVWHVMHELQNRLHVRPAQIGL
jgi:hypothetical protein